MTSADDSSYISLTPELGDPEIRDVWRARNGTPVAEVGLGPDIEITLRNPAHARALAAVFTKCAERMEALPHGTEHPGGGNPIVAELVRKLGGRVVINELDMAGIDMRGQHIVRIPTPDGFELALRPWKWREVALMAEYRIDFTLTRRQEGEADFTEIGFGGSPGMPTLDAASYWVGTILQRGEWETTKGQPDPADVLRDGKEEL
jgi:hypothetical protein